MMSTVPKISGQRQYPVPNSQTTEQSNFQTTNLCGQQQGAVDLQLDLGAQSSDFVVGGPRHGSDNVKLGTGTHFTDLASGRNAPGRRGAPSQRHECNIIGKRSFSSLGCCDWVWLEWPIGTRKRGRHMVTNSISHISHTSSLGRRR